MRNINIKTIGHTEQRYDTCGDYWTDEDGTLQMRISRMNKKYEFLVAMHELIESFLCEERGIPYKEIDTFDTEYEKRRASGIPVLEEPGDDKVAPYYKEHQFATGIERVLANELGVDWNDYNDAVENL